MLVSILCALGMYYYVCVRDVLETQLDINLDYTGIPDNLIITGGLKPDASVRITGPETLIRSIPRSSLSETINLSMIKKGETIVPVTLPILEYTARAFDVIDIDPSQLVITADTILERTVPVRIVTDSSLGDKVLTVDTTSQSNSTVVLRGPENRVSEISYVEAVINPDPKISTIQSDNVPIRTPNLVIATPARINVSFAVTSPRTVISRECAIRITGDEKHEYSVSPDKIKLLVEVPEALTEDEKYLKQLQATVVVTPMQVGEQKKEKLRISLPDGMKQINKDVDEVTITRKN